ncbi:MAG: HesA/MoeB/ThiF family protein [Planctomycetes bacterium]|nr:HesA/MoeB/ThiF family protein [Planctomycetota bacterium]
MQWTEAQIQRFSRHILLPEVSGVGQRKLLASSALVVGAGGLGSPALLYLAAAGVGRLGIVDSDAVELSNLNRQIAHTAKDVGRNKALSAAEAVHAISPDCAVWAFPERLRAENVRDVLRGYDLVLDGSDNFPTRFLVADASWLAGIPLVSAAVVQFSGQLMTVLPGKGNPCYRCFLPEAPPPETVPTCAQAGVFGPLAGVMGTLQATEALKVLLGLGGLLAHATLVVDALDWTFLTARREPDPACALCGSEPTIHDVSETHEALCCPGGRCELEHTT